LLKIRIALLEFRLGLRLSSSPHDDCLLPRVLTLFNIAQNG